MIRQARRHRGGALLPLPAGALQAPARRGGSDGASRSCRAQPTSHLPAVRLASVWAMARPRRTSGARAARKVAFSRSMSAVLIPVPLRVAASTAAMASAVPRTTAALDADHPPLDVPLDHLAQEQPRLLPPSGAARGGRCGPECRNTRGKAVTELANPSTHTRMARRRPQDTDQLDQRGDQDQVAVAG